MKILVDPTAKFDVFRYLDFTAVESFRFLSKTKATIVATHLYENGQEYQGAFKLLIDPL